MEAKATVKYVRLSPMKARRMVDLIRGRHVEEARRILRFAPQSASRTIEKALNSAVANAEQAPGVYGRVVPSLVMVGDRGQVRQPEDARDGDQTGDHSDHDGGPRCDEAGGGRDRHERPEQQRQRVGRHVVRHRRGRDESS